MINRLSASFLMVLTAVALGGGLPAQQVEGHPPQDGQIVSRVAGADAALVLAEGHVQEPVQAVLNAQVAARGPEQDPGVRRQAGDVIEGLRGDLRALPSLGLNHDQDVQGRARPCQGPHTGGTPVFRVPSSFHPEMGPFPSAAALVRAMAEGEIELRRVRPVLPPASSDPQG